MLKEKSTRILFYYSFIVKQMMLFLCVCPWLMPFGGRPYPLDVCIVLDIVSDCKIDGMKVCCI